MIHTLKIAVSAEAPPDGGIVRCRKAALRERIMRLLFGEKRRLTILVPGDNVKSLSIFKDEEENVNGQNIKT